MLLPRRASWTPLAASAPSPRTPGHRTGSPSRLRPRVPGAAQGPLLSPSRSVPSRTPGASDDASLIEAQMHAATSPAAGPPPAALLPHVQHTAAHLPPPTPCLLHGASVWLNSFMQVCRQSPACRLGAASGSKRLLCCADRHMLASLESDPNSCWGWPCSTRVPPSMR